MAQYIIEEACVSVRLHFCVCILELAGESYTDKIYVLWDAEKCFVCVCVLNVDTKQLHCDAYTFNNLNKK